MTLDARRTPSLVKGIRNRLFLWLVVVALLLSAIGAEGVFDALNNTDIVSLLDRIVPGIDFVSSRTSLPETARVTFSVEWLFFPIYFALLCIYRTPFSFVRPATKQRRRKLWSAATGISPLTLIFIWAILADWNLIPGPSVYRGSMWQPDFALTRLPYVGRAGLALAAFMTPVIEALIYWAVPAILTRFFISPLLPVANSGPTPS